MSLVIARKYDDQILVISDTKLTYPKDSTSNKNNGHPGDGTIKTIIVNTELCVAFAGDMEYAKAALHNIGDQSTARQVLIALQHQHAESAQQTDFILLTANPANITQIKNGVTTQVEHAWIGSANGFNRFQGYLLGKLTSPNYNSINLKIEVTSHGNADNLLSKVSNSFDSVIEDGHVPEVDGFKIRVGTVDGKFEYLPYVHSYKSGEIKIPALKANVIYQQSLAHADPSEGGYTINFFRSRSNTQNIAIHIRQGQFGIIYERQDLLFECHIVANIDELDFVDFVANKYRLHPSGTTQNYTNKHITDGDKYFKIRDFKKAVASYEKATKECNNKIRAKLFYQIGICFIQTDNITEAIKNFEMACRLDSSLQKIVFKILQNIGGQRK